MAKLSFEDELFELITKTREKEHKIILINAKEARYYKHLINSFQKKFKTNQKYPKFYVESAILQIPNLKNVGMISKQLAIEYKIIGMGLRSYYLHLPQHLIPVNFGNATGFMNFFNKHNNKNVGEITTEGISEAIDIEIEYLKNNIATKFENCLLFVGLGDLLSDLFVTANIIKVEFLKKILQLSKKFVIVMVDPKTKVIRPTMHIMNNFDASKNLLYNLYNYNNQEIEKFAEGNIGTIFAEIKNNANNIILEESRITNIQMKEVNNPYTIEIEERKKIIDFIKKKSKKIRTEEIKTYLDYAKK